MDPGTLTLVHTLHRGHATEASRLGLFFLAVDWVGEPAITEPSKCSAMMWFPLEQLPADMVPYPRAGLEGHLRGAPYAELGW
ncbi:hypothetical protein JOF29_000117 [Kribbella aluminosa]|uniref:NUDIX domain-containing protein n=1 Tax=Kribbella aluminosa TaxID=416017 RepID=A0ABS4UBK5_9ACTN|nr:hypothetical protein [Kribbella aluminosa]